MPNCPVGLPQSHTLFLQMGKLIGSLENQLTVEGEEINGYMDKH